MSNKNNNSFNRTGDRAGKENKTNTPLEESRKEGVHSPRKQNHARGQKSK